MFKCTVSIKTLNKIYVTILKLTTEISPAHYFKNQSPSGQIIRLIAKAEHHCWSWTACLDSTRLVVCTDCTVWPRE